MEMRCGSFLATCAIIINHLPVSPATVGVWVSGDGAGLGNHVQEQLSMTVIVDTWRLCQGVIAPSCYFNEMRTPWRIWQSWALTLKTGWK